MVKKKQLPIILIIALCLVFSSCGKSGNSEETPAQKCLTTMLECPNEELFPGAFSEPLYLPLEYDEEEKEALSAAMEEWQAAQDAADEVWKEQLGCYFLEGDFDAFMGQWERLQFHGTAAGASLKISIKELQEEEVKDRVQWINVTLTLTNENGDSEECVTRWQVVYLDDSLDMIYKIRMKDDGDFTQIVRELSLDA